MTLTVMEPSKKRSDKYYEKLKIKSSFADVMKVSVSGNPAVKPKSNKA